MGQNNMDLWRNAWNSTVRPLREGTSLQRLFDDLFTDWAHQRLPSGAVGTARATTFVPACEVTEDKGAYTLKFEVPGIPKESIKIDLHDSTLTVSGERREEKTEGTGKNTYTEFSYGSFTRTFTLPTTVNREKVDAAYNNGVLTVTLEKTTPVQGRQVTIR